MGGGFLETQAGVAGETAAHDNGSRPGVRVVHPSDRAQNGWVFPALHRTLLGFARPLTIATVGLVWLAAAATAAAHGDAAPAPVLPGVLLAWSFDPRIVLPVTLTAAAYLLAVRRVDRAHPANPVPAIRSVCWLLGLGAIVVALQSPIERYDTTLFGVHMAQHILLIMVAAPLLALGAPITLLLRVARPETRRRVILPILHSWPVRAVTFPLVTWLLFALTMWGTHFSPIFDRSLEEPAVHQLEHLLYLVTACLFWWPVVALDPNPWRMSEPVRIVYTFLQMPQNSFLGLAIVSATAPLYHHYATLVRDWGPSVMEDQQMAGAAMWVVGDLIFLAAILGIVVSWMHREERETRAADARDDAARAAIRERESRLAERLSRERSEG